MRFQFLNMAWEKCFNIGGSGKMNGVSISGLKFLTTFILAKLSIVLLPMMPM